MHSVCGTSTNGVELVNLQASVPSREGGDGIGRTRARWEVGMRKSGMADAWVVAGCDGLKEVAGEIERVSFGVAEEDDEEEEIHDAKRRERDALNSQRICSNEWTLTTH
jgi:hypothetical protein